MATPPSSHAPLLPAHDTPARELDEAETRRLIDAQLREAGWEVDSEHLTHERGARPEAGRNRALAE